MNFHTMSSSYYAEKKYIWVIDVLSIPGVSLEPLGFSGYPKRLFDILVPGEHRETGFLFVCLFVCFVIKNSNGEVKKQSIFSAVLALLEPTQLLFQRKTLVPV